MRSSSYGRSECSQKPEGVFQTNSLKDRDNSLSAYRNFSLTRTNAGCSEHLPRSFVTRRVFPASLQPCGAAMFGVWPESARATARHFDQRIACPPRWRTHSCECVIIMIFNFGLSKATPVSTDRNGPASGWLSTARNSGKVVSAGRITRITRAPGAAAACMACSSPAAPSPGGAGSKVGTGGGALPPPSGILVWQAMKPSPKQGYQTQSRQTQQETQALDACLPRRQREGINALDEVVAGCSNQDAG